MTFKTSCLILAVSLLSHTVFAQGGPPLVTDDPGTPGDGSWEINSAVQWISSDESATFQFPLFDINYGYGDHIQLNLNSSLNTVTQRTGSTTSGGSLASVATKWRFLDEESFGLAVSTYPRVDFHHSFSSNDPVVNSPGTRYFLPIEFSKEFGRWGINPEIGYATYSQVSSEWVYGLATSYTFEKEKEALFEIHGRSLVNSSDREWLYNFGIRYRLTDKISFIGSLGKILVPYSDELIAWNVYAGFQFRL